jgi:hypothetical protein
MSLFKRARATAAHYGRLFLHLGPLGVSFALQDAWLSRRIASYSTQMDREKELHRSMVAGINAQLNIAIGRRASIRISASHFRRDCEKRDAEMNKPVAGA